MFCVKVFLTLRQEPVEWSGYRLMGVRVVGLTTKRYSASDLAFGAVGFVFEMAVLMLRCFLPLSQEGMKGLSFSLAFNAAASFVSDKYWKVY
ncbi:hypothetical protein AWI74_14380 [Listeria monocytogenes]|nr:hypothetical protein AWI74_14380 [Listeria monocytogenes]